MFSTRVLPILAILGVTQVSFLFAAECNKTAVNEYLGEANELTRQQTHTLIVAQWNNAANITPVNEALLVSAAKDWDSFRKSESERAKSFFNTSCLEPYDVRQLEKLAIIGTSSLNGVDASRFQKVQLEMETTYSTAVIELDNKKLSLEPHLTNLFAQSTNESELRSAWIKWRQATGDRMREQYVEYYKLGNKAAKQNRLPGKARLQTYDDLWMFAWETPDLKAQIDVLMTELTPLYEKIHAYTRFHLKQKYPDTMPADGTIPAHLLGNMWAQQWSNLLSSLREINPHPDIEPMDSKVNERLQALTIRDMYVLSEKFFAGMGLPNMTRTFWQESILEKPTDRNLTCHASAWDFYDGEDFRIKQCTERTITELVTVHHEMGHIQYYQNYAHQPSLYREGANPGFHEAIGDLIALSVGTPQHLAKVNLLDASFVADEQMLAKLNLNYQLKMALEKIVFLPFSYIMDRWRWDVFGNPDLENKLNRHWWNLRIKHQGISPPVRRSESNFDPGAKYHIPANVEYVRYFVSHVLQFQFFEYLCTQKVHHVGDLYKCDLDGSVDAGAALKSMLAKGSSDTWRNILRDFIGTEKMSLAPLLNYFQPLQTFLDEFIAKNNIKVGWEKEVVDQYMDKPTVAPVISRAPHNSPKWLFLLTVTLLGLVSLSKRVFYFL